VHTNFFSIFDELVSKIIVDASHMLDRYNFCRLISLSLYISLKCNFKLIFYFSFAQILCVCRLVFLCISAMLCVVGVCGGVWVCVGTCLTHPHVFARSYGPGCCECVEKNCALRHSCLDRIVQPYFCMVYIVSVCII